MTFSTHDIVPDSPTNNFATLANQLQHDATSSAVSDGNLRFLQPSNSNLDHDEMSNAIANFSATSGKKWYWEVVIFNNIDSNQRIASSIGVILQQNDTQGNVLYSTDYFNGTCYAWGNDTNDSSRTSSVNVFQRNGSTVNQVSPAQESYLIHGTVVGVLLDLESSPNTVTLYANGSELPDRGGITTKMNLAASTQFFPIFGCGTTGGTQTHLVNFGQDPTFGGAKSPSTTYTDANGIGAFYYQPPTDALALCTANLPDFTPTVTGDVPADYFKTVLWTGQTADSTFIDNGDNTWSKTGVGFQPDLVWLKRRNSSTITHQLLDVVRGKIGNAASFSRLRTDTTATEATPASDSGLLSMGSNGFTLGTDSAYNDSGSTYVAWCWKAGGAPTADNTSTSGAMTANSVSLNGTLQSNYTPAGSPTIYPKRMSINTDVGFSIVKYVGDGSTNNSSPATVPSGLSDVDVVLVKNLDYGSHPNQANNVCNWQVYHKSLSSNHNLLLDVANAEYDITASGAGGIQVNNGNLQLITRTVSQTWNANVNDSGDNYIAYCWHSVEGYSKFGSYTGNGSADGPFVYTGFRPAFVICKCSSDTTTTNTSWAMYDNARDSSNVMNKVLYANQNIKEGYRGDASTAATDIYIDFLSNGFKVRSTKEEVNDSGETYIFMAFAEQPFKFSNAR